MVRLAIFLLWQAATTHARLVSQEYDILEKFYYSTNGNFWLTQCQKKWNFNGFSDPCIQSWFGVTCTPSSCIDTDCYVSSLTFTSCNLTGTLPEEIGNLSTLNSLSLGENSIAGTLPSSISKPNLNFLELGNNLLSGSLPSLPNSLFSLSLRRNLFSGALPMSFGNISSLISLDLRQNKFTGTFPQNFLSFSSLVSIVIDTNYFTGPVPSPIGSQMQSFTVPTCQLVTFNFGDNKITGSLVAEYFPSLRKLNEFNLSYNALTGPIPSTLALLSRLRTFEVTRNQLTGQFGDIFRATSLKELSLGDNLFTGHMSFTALRATQLTELKLENNLFSGPIDFNRAYEYLSILDLSSNYFSSSFPASFANMTAIQQLALDDNLFTSSIPFELATRPFLRLVDLNSNFITGTIPYQLFNSSIWYPTYSLLFNLYLHGNYLSGSIPNNICRAVVIRQVSLFNNLLTGTIPHLQDCVSIQTILLQSNYFTGDPGLAFEVSTSSIVKYNNFSLLQVVDLSDNDFTGTIPRQIFQSPRILFVAIVGGCFHGNFPLEICNATSLKALVLEGLRSGRHCREDFWDPLSVIANRVYRTSTVGKKLPKCIWNLTNLETLYLSGNLMEGSIPETQSLPSSLVRLSLSYNKLTGTIPKILQRQPFEYFDLEHNRLTGTSEDIHISAERYNDTQVTLSVNRLSGHIGNLNYLKHVDVLSGNIYSCSSSRSDLPHNDPESLTYLCGSDALDLTLLFWFLLTVLFVFIVALSLYTIQYRRRFSSSFSDSSGLRRSTLSMLVNFSSPSSLWNKSSERDSEVITCENPLSRVDSNLSSENENERESAVTKNTFQERISDNIHLVLEYHQEISQMNKNSNPELTRFLKTLSSLRMIAIQLGLLAITVFLGFYLIMKLQLDSGTHEYQYRWLYSVAFLSNRDAAIVLLILITGLLFYLVASITRLTSQSEAIRTRSRSWKSSMSEPGLELTKSPLPSPFHEMGPGMEESETDEDAIFSSPHSYTTKALLSSYAFILSVVLVDMLLVLLVKGSYVYLVIWRDITPSLKILVQICLSLFDISWNTFVVTRILMIFPSLMRSKVRVKLHLTLLIFNSIVAPIIATVLTDRSCLADMFQYGDEITSSGSYTLCDQIDIDTKLCVSTSDVALSTSFQPPYNYSYQCSSAVLVNFIPVFILTYSMLSFIQPILLFCLVYFITRSKPLKSMLVVLPSILWPNRAHKYEFRKVILANPIVSGLLHHIVVLLTFGIACPPLGVVIATSICLITFQWELIIGRYLNVRKKRPSKNVSTFSASNFNLALENACVGVWIGPMKAVYTMIDVTSVVYSIMLFDIAGDRIGGFPAFYTVSIPMLCVPVLIRVGYRWIYPLLTRKQQEGRQKSTSRAECIQVEIIESHSVMELSSSRQSESVLSEHPLRSSRGKILSESGGSSQQTNDFESKGSSLELTEGYFNSVSPEERKL